MSDDVWVTVPTAGRDTLTGAIDSTGIPRSRVLIVVTGAEAITPPGCLMIEDPREINIHRWWNRGIDACVERGARYVLVINDDVLMDADTVPTLLAAMQETGATIASPGGGGLFTDPDKYRGRVMNGACWLLDTTHGLRPDEGFRWWYGDDLLDWRARQGHGVVSVPAYFEHLHANHLTSTTPFLTELTQVDAQRWNSL